MDPTVIAEEIDRIIRSINMLDWGEDIDIENSVYLLHEQIVPDLEDLSNNIYIAEEERQFSEGCGGLAFCLFCGSRFIHGQPHPCKEMRFRKDGPD